MGYTNTPQEKSTGEFYDRLKARVIAHFDNVNDDNDHELCEGYKQLMEIDPDKVDHIIRNELASQFFSTISICRQLGIDLEEMLTRHLDTLENEIK